MFKIGYRKIVTIDKYCTVIKIIYLQVFYSGHKIHI